MTTKRRGSIHECLKCPHLSTSHRLVKGAPIEGPYRCQHCSCEVQQSDPTRLITPAEAERLHAQEMVFNERAAARRRRSGAV